MFPSPITSDSSHHIKCAVKPTVTIKQADGYSTIRIDVKSEEGETLVSTRLFLEGDAAILFGGALASAAESSTIDAMEAAGV